MKNILKKTGTALLLILTGAVIYFVSATVYYRVTGDDRHSGMLGLRCTMIYVIALLIDGFFRRMRRLKTEGVLFGCGSRDSSGQRACRRGVNNAAAWLYGAVLAALISFMMYYIVPEDSPLEDTFVWLAVLSAFAVLILIPVFIITWMHSRSAARSDKDNAVMHGKISALYGENTEHKQYTVREYSYKYLCEALAAVFGARSAVYELVDHSTGKLRGGVSCDEVLSRADSDPVLLPVLPCFLHSPQAMRADVNLLCERAGLDVRISEQELRAAMDEYDSEQDVRRRIDFKMPWIHDMNLIERILRSKGYALVYITAVFSDSPIFEPDYDGDPDEEDIDFENDVVSRNYIAVCPARNAVEFAAGDARP